MFNLSTDLNNLKTEELILYYESLYDIVHCQFKKCIIYSVWMADLLSLQRLYNTYKLVQNKNGKKVRRLYASLLEIFWNIIAGKKTEQMELDEYMDLEEVAVLLNCGTKEDLKEDYIRPFCEKFFFD